jgi:hypothetical protein
VAPVVDDGVLHVSGSELGNGGAVGVLCFEKGKGEVQAGRYLFGGIRVLDGYGVRWRQIGFGGWEGKRFQGERGGEERAYP